MATHRTRLRGIRNGLTLFAVLGPVGAALGATAVLNPSSSWLLLHHPGGPTGSPTIIGGQAISPTSSPPISYNTTKTFTGGTTKGKAGLGRTQSSTVAKVVFPSGIGVDQTDPGGAQSASAVRIEFNAVFDIEGSGSFGATINPTFTIPFGATIAPGGIAQFGCEINWDKKIGGVTSSARSTYNINDGVTYTNGSDGSGGLFTNGGGSPISVLKTFTTNPAAMSPTSITGNVGNQLIVRGFIQFAANNPDGPVTAVIPRDEFDPHDPTEQDPFQFFTGGTPEDQFVLNMIPESGFEVFVPEPTCGVLLAIPALLLRRGRRA